jgi:hypothetical protein
LRLRISLAGTYVMIISRSSHVSRVACTAVMVEVQVFGCSVVVEVASLRSPEF